MSARSYTLKPISSNSNEISPIRTEWKLNCASRPTMSEYLTTHHPPKIHLEEFREKVFFFKKKNLISMYATGFHHTHYSLIYPWFYNCKSLCFIHRHLSFLFLAPYYSFFSSSFITNK